MTFLTSENEPSMTIKRIGVLLFVIFLAMGLLANQEKNKCLQGRGNSEPVSFEVKELKIEGDLGKFKTTLRSETLAKGLQIVTFSIHSETAEVPPVIWLKWSMPSIDVHGFWNTNLNPDRVNYYRNSVTSRASRGAPVLSYYNNQDMNRLTMACSDGLNKIIMKSYLKEEDARLYFHIGLFDEKNPAITDYTLQLLVDTRPIPFYSSLKGVGEWWASQEGYTPAPVPDSCRMPMYSTWYSFHQNLNVDEVLRECQISKKLGLEAVIVDDGWQTLDSQRGYAYTGDWEPIRLPDMKGFVDRVHQLGMKFILWYSLPFIGEKSKNYDRFKGKYLRYWDGQGAYVLDPRYPEVREFIIKVYETALKEWKLDGFKLDFIGFFAAQEDTVMTAEEGRDFASVNKAVDRLMTDIMKRLRSMKPDIMIEFRQRYIGPLMRKYGNMFRAADCPNMAATNRIRTTDIRLISGNTAVHSDMFMWHPEEPVEIAALQILDILFSVPQLSVRLDTLPGDHLEMVIFWMKYWKENREVLLDGTFMPSRPASLYPILRAHTKTKAIIAIYDDFVIPLENIPKGEYVMDIINAKGNCGIVLDLTQDLGKVTLKIYDCKGKIKKEEEKILKKGIHKLECPSSGIIRIFKKVK
jgi:alpha-galactosidase